MQRSGAAWKRGTKFENRPRISCFTPNGSNNTLTTSNSRTTASKTVWPSGLRRWLKAPVRKGVGSNPTAVTWKSQERLLDQTQHDVP